MSFTFFAPSLVAARSLRDVKRRSTHACLVSDVPRKYARRNIIMGQEIAKNAAQEAVRAAGIEGLVEASARSVDAKLPAEVSTVGSRV